MSASEFLSKINRLGVKVWTDGGRLRFDAPAGGLTQDLRDDMQKYEAQIIEFLTGAPDGCESEGQAIEPAPREEELPLSFAQQRLWFLDQLVPQSAFYNVSAGFRLQGALDIETLQRCLDELVARHETLRTTFPDRRGKPIQLIGPPTRLDLPVVDLTGVAAAEREAEMDRLLAEETERPFVLARGPLLCARLLRLDDEDHALLLTMHHVISDGWSCGVLLRELGALYTAFRKGRPSPLPELPIQYADFTLWERKWLKGERLDSHLNYWKHHLKGAATLQLPTDRARPAVQTFRGAWEFAVFPEASTKELEALSRREGATLFMTLLAAFKVLLHRYTGQDDVVVGTPIANRNRPEIEGLIGFFINSLVMRTDVSGNPSFRELLRRVREIALDAYEHQDLPFERLVDELEPERDLSRNPLFQVAFSLQDVPMRPLVLTDLALSWIDKGPIQTTRFDLELHVWRTTGGLQLAVIYNTDLFDASSIRRLQQHYQLLLEAIVADPNQRISHVTFMGEAERRQVLTEWNQTATDYPKEATVHQLFEQQVEQRPDAVAVQLKGQLLTYRQLNARANQLAHHLTKLGVGPDVTVGVCVERSLEMVVGILGVLKAGGAYVPLAPDYPKQRLLFMVQDAKSPVLLTQSYLAANFHDHAAKVICLDTDWPSISLQSDQDPLPIREEMGLAPGPCLEEAEKNGLSRVPVPISSRPRPGPTAENLAYLIYTSGSTGQPKGVEITHGGLSNLVHWHRRTYEVTAADRATQLASFSFDASVWELWPYLASGASIHVVDDDTRNSPAKLWIWLQEQEITITFLPTPLAEAALQQPLPKGLALRAMLTGGDRLRSGPDRPLPFDLINHYGPSENTVVTTSGKVGVGGPDDRPPPIGRPISNVQVYVLDGHMNPLPVGVSGELCIGGAGLARGYHRRTELTTERFVANPFQEDPKARLYRTGDLCRWLPDGNLEFLGRIDRQVKIRGFRIELGEIEAVLRERPSVSDAVVVAREDTPGDKRLVAYLVFAGGQPAETSRLREVLKEKLPSYMVPSALVAMDSLPLTPSGKVDQDALPLPERQVEEAYVAPHNELEKQITAVWQDVLGIDQVGVRDNFFDLGGNSLLLVRVHANLTEQFHDDLTLVDLFRYPTVESLAYYLEGAIKEIDLVRGAKDRVSKRRGASDTDGCIAVVGMAGRFPGAQDLTSFWSNLREGVESIRFFTDEQLREAGVDQALIDDPRYVKARGVLDEVELFDASFFGYSPREAEIIDPQQRIFLECAWEALERAGYDPGRYEGLIGVYPGASTNTYLLNLQSRPDIWGTAGGMQAALSNDKDHLPTRVSYQLNLRGPSVNIQTACSTSLVAVHEACRSLLDYECDMALAGGVSVTVPAIRGYVYQEEGIGSPDGHCRAFDSQAQGTVAGDGVGVVVLKRLGDALADGDVIDAVILGTAINNDGSLKVGYTAPSVEGQAEAIAMAQAAAGVEPDTIGYIETHGTGTALGDPIEVEALMQVFGRKPRQQGFCALGALKSNVGHLDAAAGVAGLVKTILCLKHRELVPSLHFKRPNPKIDFDQSPFRVNTELRPWVTKDAAARRAGVSSFGIGGTNAHAIIEEAPVQEPSGPSRPWQLLVLSTKTATALEVATRNLAAHLKRNDELDLADVAYTLQVGRREFDHRRVVVCRESAGGVEALEGRDPGRCWTDVARNRNRPVAFMFPGQGSQYVNMGRELYEGEPVFREQVNQCCALLSSHLGMDLREVLYGDNHQAEAATNRLRQTAVTQPALFVIEYALARLWMHWGVRPQAMIGHSSGEYVAACLAGVFSLEDALSLVAMRGRLMQELPAGAMTAVPMPPAETKSQLDDRLSLAAVNTPSLCVVSGPTEAVASLEAEFAEQGVECRRLHTSHAFHSPMMDPILKPWYERVNEIDLHAPQIPYVSNVTGTWVTAAEATDPDYWTKHLRQTVRFADGIDKLLDEPDRVLLEVGPGRTLSTLAGLHPDRTPRHAILSSIRSHRDPHCDLEFLLGCLGRLWIGGVSVDWASFYGDEHRLRVVLPTYPFERQRYWVEPYKGDGDARRAAAARKRSLDEWFYGPSWTRTVWPQEPDSAGVSRRGPGWLVFADGCGLGANMARRLERLGHDVAVVTPAERFEHTADRAYAVRPAQAEDYESVIESLVAADFSPSRVLHLWSVTDDDADAQDSRLERSVHRGFHSLVFLAQALDSVLPASDARILIVSNQVQEVTGEENLRPEKSLLLGPCRVIVQEYPNVTCRNVDLEVSRSGRYDDERLIDRLLAEFDADTADPVVAYRGAHRWVPSFEPLQLDVDERVPARLRRGGVYLITGGLGGIGLELAECLFRACRARLVLTGRRGLPPQAEWDNWIAARDDADETTRTIEKVKTLQSLGAEVLVAAADVADFTQMQAAVNRARDRFGAVHGVVHAAGIAPGGIIQLKDRRMAQAVLRPKVNGTLVLSALFEDAELDFLVLCSSLASVLGGAGQVDYCAANAFLDAFAHRHRWGGTHVVAVNWDTWTEAGMAVDTSLPELLDEERKKALSKGVLSKEGHEVFHRILGSDLPQVLVSTRDLPGRMVPAEPDSAESDDSETSRQVPQSPQPAYARPNLPNDYVAPRNGIEQGVAELWQTLFGIEPIGIHDNFFDLGGHSLLATQMLNKLRQTYTQADLSIRKLFTNPTIADLAALIEAADGQSRGSKGESIRERLLAAAPRDRAGLIELYLNEEIGLVFGEEGAGAGADAPQGESGVDLIVSDLVWVFKRDLDLRVYPHEIRDRRRPAELAEFVVAELERLSQLGSAETDGGVSFPRRDRRGRRPAEHRRAVPAERNEPVIFVLSAPRSGSTLLRLMLAGHSALFSPPELGLLGFATMGRRRAGWRSPFSQESIVQVFMTLMDLDVEKAGALVEDLTRRDVPIEAVYRLVQQHLDGRTLVDKTAGYAVNPDTLERAEALFEGARYIHLVRHPYPVIESFVRNRFDRLLGEKDASAYAVAEKYWAMSNSNVLEFFASIEEDRRHRVRFEDLVREPRTVMTGICDFLGLAFEEAVLQPYGPARMIAGPGDPDVLQHDKIDSRLGEVWKDVRLPHRLSPFSMHLAAELVYQLPHDTPVSPDAQQATKLTRRPVSPVPRDAELPLSFAQQRLWFVHQLDPDDLSYNMRLPLRLRGRLDRSALGRSLDELVRRHESLRTRFPSTDGTPRQVVEDARPVKLEMLDLSDLSADDKEAGARRLAAAEVRRPFDLSRGPLFRSLLIRLNERDHLLVLTIHHIVSDGWSLSVLSREFGVLYEAFRKGRPSPLADLKIQYPDFAVWQRDWLQGEVLDEQLAYWSEKLEGLATLQLPTDHPRPPMLSNQGAAESLELPGQLAERLKTLGQRHGATLFMTLLAALKTLLHRYTGQDDVVVGSPVANRTEVQLESLIGLFVNSLVMRTSLSGDPSFSELLGHMRDTALEAYAHQDLPFEKLVDELEPRRDLSRNPLFQVFFSLQNAPTQRLDMVGLSAGLTNLGAVGTPFDLEAHAWEVRDGLCVQMRYSTDLFEPATIRRMLRHFRVLLEAIVSEPEQRLSEFSILPDDERQQLLAEWNRTDTDYPKDACLHQLFETQAERTPDSEAVVFQSQRLTYAQLNAEANQLARDLRCVDVGPETLVGVYMERSVEMVVVLLGILKAGGAYVPLDPAHPAERVRTMLEDARVPLVLTQEPLLERLPETGAIFRCVDRNGDVAQTEHAGNVQSSVMADNLCYVIFTSGSTGKPKGVQIEHRNAVNFIESMRKEPGLRRDDAMLAVTTLSFDISLLELFLPLTVGARVVIADREEVTDGKRLVQKLTGEHVTAMQATPATWELMLQTGWQERLPLKVLCGGEAMPSELAHRLKTRCRELWNVYGPTETTVWSTSRRVEKVEEPVPVGRPIANTQVYILDQALRPVPIGVRGELYIGGDGVARGYLNRPELTADRFVPDPFGEAPGARLYKTGDVARYRPDGCIEVLGRSDFQVKIRGFRIELGEIEGSLLAHPGIRQAAVLAREDTPAEKQLVAYLVAAEDSAPSFDDLRRFLKEKLPDYMVPAAFVQMDSLPLNPNGKVDRQALPRPTGERQTAEAFVAPRSDAECRIAEIWGDVLQVEKVGIHDNFFEIGGHSLRATQVVSRIAGAFEVDLPLRTIFDAPTVAELAEFVEAKILEEISQLSEDEARRLVPE